MTEVVIIIPPNKHTPDITYCEVPDVHSI